LRSHGNRPRQDCRARQGHRVIEQRCAPIRRKSGGSCNGTVAAIKRLHEWCKRGIKTQTMLPSADTAAMRFWALLASGQIAMRKING